MLKKMSGFGPKNVKLPNHKEKTYEHISTLRGRHFGQDKTKLPNQEKKTYEHISTLSGRIFRQTQTDRKEDSRASQPTREEETNSDRQEIMKKIICLIFF